MSYVWPKQSECDTFYGNPVAADGTLSDKWYASNLVKVNVPWAMHMGKIPIARFVIHRKCEEATKDWLETVWKNASQSQETISRWHMDSFSGSFNFRSMRGINHLSMHAYGCAMDFDAPNNGLGSKDGFFHHNIDAHDAVVMPFKRLGGTWGGDWKTRPDPMHFQWATV